MKTQKCGHLNFERQVSSMNWAYFMVQDKDRSWRPTHSHLRSEPAGKQGPLTKASWSVIGYKWGYMGPQGGPQALSPLNLACGCHSQNSTPTLSLIIVSLPPVDSAVSSKWWEGAGTRLGYWLWKRPIPPMCRLHEASMGKMTSSRVWELGQEALRSIYTQVCSPRFQAIVEREPSRKCTRFWSCLSHSLAVKQVWHSLWALVSASVKWGRWISNLTALAAFTILDS